jgi:hypothetical protein
MQRITLFATSLILVAMLVAGCGSSTSSSDKAAQASAVINAAAASSGSAAAAAKVPESGAKLSKVQYIAKADKICDEMVKIRDKTEADYLRAAKAGQALVAAAILDRDTPLYSAWLGKFHGLRQPKNKKSPVLGQLLALLDNQAQINGAQAAALRSNSLPALNQIAQARIDARKTTKKLGKSYGFKVCGDAIQTAR